MRSSCTPRLFWLIVRRETGQTRVLTTELVSGEEALLVFSFEEEAGMFLKLGAPNDGWQVRETTVGELTSILYSVCASVGRVVLDPLPRRTFGALNELVSMEREAFMGFYFNKQEPRARAEQGSPPALRPSRSDSHPRPSASERATESGPVGKRRLTEQQPLVRTVS